MRRKQEELINYLYTHNEKVTANILSKALNLSIRTIKSYIAELNMNYPSLISSSNRGYVIDKVKANSLLQYKDDIPQDYESRCIYIIKKTLLEKQDYIDIFDLCEELFISYSTLKKDIYKMNTSFANFKITFSSENNKLHVGGSEQNKRKLISHVMSEEVSGNFLVLTLLQESFPDYDLDDACTLIKDICKQHHYYLNDFSCVNFILHVTIMVSRINHGNHIINNNELIQVTNKNDEKIAKELCLALEQVFNVSFNSSEILEIYILFKNNANYINNENENVSLLVSDEIIQITKNIIKNVDELFFINLDSDNFITPFMLHLKNLKNRLIKNNLLKNPMLDSIKISCPTIYDISTFIAYQLTLSFHENVNEDEIAFIALHVGTEIERQKKEETKVSCLLLCPEYLNITSTLHKKIMMDFGDQLTIQKSISFENEILGNNFDLLITTVPVLESTNYFTVLLPPFPMSYEKNKILDAIIRIENTKKSQILTNNLNFYFNEKLFYSMNEDISKSAVINELAERMINLGYVEENFKEEIWKRETASSTAFMNIAIPHPMKMSAYKTSIGVVISHKGIDWGNQHFVNVVFMIAFNKIDNKHFHALYESLVLLFNEPIVISEIKKCKNFNDFKDIVIKNYLKFNER
ncbi:MULTISPECIES: BglG family transcription antiterminator [Thomasclavelia]|uniref:BglG family transcription antiterminator n=1 Tax=Thomasclavelia TaxID=3025755 RepID=UPI001C38F45D|nr:MULTISPECIES: PTS sugar transporter subunit IIA [Thomasclavelia]MBV3127977.1 PRD domain-containing protein [Thomasclavelia ramosa]MBV3131781.1 PRD domain-containing protein [Thomasclavelia ramosa]MBV3140154.1 PRD domain-containing protein [Thomasclavelia ramosa]MBV3143643.1 PRD domain-containing protein [Thomasclavelia ramosa]MBV3151886.1 PRD domain-containing protein [Thomasclavelia ramosa]